MPLVAVARFVAMSSDVLIGIPSINGSAAVQWVNAPINSDKRVTDQEQLTGVIIVGQQTASVNPLLVVLIISRAASAEHQRARHLHHAAAAALP